ncbi:MAG: hypothetical protein HYZ29_18130 [Myxococcales bacterium]|nr:hypothetical protein [Myxococcales bacterium]
MAESRGPLRAALPVVLLALSALGLYNVFADNTEVRQMAQKLAASPKDTQPRITREAKNPIGQSFELSVDGRGQVSVSCRRAFYLVGEWACSVEGGAAPAPSASAK